MFLISALPPSGALRETVKINYMILVLINSQKFATVLLSSICKPNFRYTDYKIK